MGHPQDRFWFRVVLTVAVVVALFSARPYAGAWNDGSRLASVECFVDHQTFIIDQSIFVRPQPDDSTPYPLDNALLRRGTLDKIFVNGHFYSDKSPVPALLLAIVYQGLSKAIDLRADVQPWLFCYLMTLASAGLAYVVAVTSIFRLGQVLGLSRRVQLSLTAAFALATIVPVYAQHVNNHILLLGVTAALMPELALLVQGVRPPGYRVMLWGSLVGFGYTIDAGVGPPLLVCFLGLIVWRLRSVGAVVAVLLGAMPWLVLHHAVNHAIGGTLVPANAVAAYLDWPGSPFPADKMTGTWNHAGFGGFLEYAAALLFGKRGFVGHNLPLFLVLIATSVLLWRRRREWPEVVFSVVFCTGVWLVYAVGSRNSSGMCCSIRWFVPLLGPQFFVLALFLKRHPGCLGDLLILGGWGAVLTVVAWWYGPWVMHMVPGFWPIQAVAFCTWGSYRWWTWRANLSRPLSLPRTTTVLRG